MIHSVGHINQWQALNNTAISPSSISTHKNTIYASLVQRWEHKPVKIKHSSSNVIMFICYILCNLLITFTMPYTAFGKLPSPPQDPSDIFATFCTILITEYEKVQQIQLDTNRNIIRRTQFGTFSYDRQVNHFSPQKKRKIYISPVTDLFSLQTMWKEKMTRSETMCPKKVMITYLQSLYFITWASIHEVKWPLKDLLSMVLSFLWSWTVRELLWERRCTTDLRQKWC
jgi:hypothetical protein